MNKMPSPTIIVHLYCQSKWPQPTLLQYIVRVSSTLYFLLQGQVAPNLTFTIIVGATPLWISTPCYCHFIVRASGPTFLLYNVSPLSLLHPWFYKYVTRPPPTPPPPPIIVFIVGLVARASGPHQPFCYMMSFPTPTPPVIFVHTWFYKEVPPSWNS